MNLSVDIISDLHIAPDEEFDWSDKPTSLFCLVAGGVSSDPNTLDRVLSCLGQAYRGVFFIDGARDHANVNDINSNIDTFSQICSKYTNVVYLHNHVVILNHIALIGINGWYHNYQNDDPVAQTVIDAFRMDDISFLSNTIKKMRKHKDVKKIAILSGSVPAEDFLYQQQFDGALKIEPGMALFSDESNQVTTWMFGGCNIQVDTESRSRRFVNNPRVPGQPYWPKRVNI